MNITEIRVKLVSSNAERLRAFCSVTFDGGFVIRDLKVIEGTNGPFVAMPSRKLADRCPKCGCKNHLRARYCNDCGGRLKENRSPRGSQRRAKLHADIAHPINAACREEIQSALIEAYQHELERAKQPGYQPQSLGEDDDVGPSDYDELVAGLKETEPSRKAEPIDNGNASEQPPRRGAPRNRRPPGFAAGQSVPEGPADSPHPAPEQPSSTRQEDDGFGVGIL